MASGQDANPNLLPLLRGKLETVHAEIQQLNVSPGFARGGLRLCGRGRRRSPHARRVSAARAARVDLFVTADRRQAQAAESLGLKTELIEV